MKVCDNYEIVKSGQSIDIVKTVGENKKGDPIVKVAHYGTVYQALQGFLDIKLSDALEIGEEIYELGEDIKEIVWSIEQSKKYIKENFCIEVKSQ